MPGAAADHREHPLAEDRRRASPTSPGRTARRSARRSPRAAHRGRRARGTGSRRASRVCSLTGCGSSGSSSVLIQEPSRLLLQPVKLWATNRLTPLALAAARRFSVPSVRSRFVSANQRSKWRKSGEPERAVISWMMASGSARATASPIAGRVEPSTTTGSAPSRPDRLRRLPRVLSFR